MKTMLGLSKDEDGAPWYVEVFLAIGGWVSALLAVIAIFFLAERLGGAYETPAEFSWIALAFGAGFIAAGLAIAQMAKGDFARHFSIATLSAGFAAAALSLWVLLYEWLKSPLGENQITAGWTGLMAALALLLAGGAVALRLKDAIASFLFIAAVYALSTISLFLASGGGDALWRLDQLTAPLAAFAGALIFLRAPYDRLLGPAGAALIIAPMLHYFFVLRFDLAAGQSAEPIALRLYAEAMVAGATLYALYRMRARYSLNALAPAGALLLAGVWFLPPAGAIAILLLAAGLAANHRPVAAAGVIAITWFIVRFYYDLSLTLLEKSAILTGLGLAMLTAALIWRRIKDKSANEDTAPSRAKRRGALAIFFFAGVLAAALGYINYNIWRLETTFAEARVIYLPLGPRDPRSLIQGDYMVLNFDAEIYPPFEARQAMAAEGEIILSLDIHSVARFSRLAGESSAPGANEIVIDYVKTDYNDIRYCPTSYFFQEGEGEAYQGARFAILRVASDGQTLLAGLADENFRRIIPGDNLDAD